MDHDDFAIFAVSLKKLYCFSCCTATQELLCASHSRGRLRIHSCLQELSLSVSLTTTRLQGSLKIVASKVTNALGVMYGPIGVEWGSGLDHALDAQGLFRIRVSQSCTCLHLCYPCPDCKLRPACILHRGPINRLKLV